MVQGTFTEARKMGRAEGRAEGEAARRARRAGRAPSSRHHRIGRGPRAHPAREAPGMPRSLDRTGRPAPHRSPTSSTSRAKPPDEGGLPAAAPAHRRAPRLRRRRMRTVGHQQHLSWADKTLAECPAAAANSGLGGNCASDPYDNCMAGCLAGTTCQELEQDSGQGGDCSEQCYCAGQSDCGTPLVLSFDSAPVRFARGGGAFDLGMGAGVATDWPSAATPWLALDRNGNGVIDDGSELFGSATPLRAGGLASNGFVALRELDSDGDGAITASDEAWARLLVWTNRDGNRVSSPDELVPLSRTGVVRIDLGFSLPWRCNRRGNCEGERARFVFRSAEGDEHAGEVVDVYLRAQRE